ncbi:MAG: TonB-dependent receptor plug domain-containing protein [Bacteroidales bacterium]|nr:TonB-dependent receptor plug domain-containing protein [Bacteroidales bacterium]
MKAKVLFLLIIVFTAGFQVQGQKRAKKIMVSSTVTDINNSPVEGAIIVVDGKSKDEVTKSQGTFNIRVRPDVKMIGAYSSTLGSAESELNGNTSINIVLNGSFAIKDLVIEDQGDDELVDIGYGTARKKTMTHNASVINARENKNNSYINIYDMIRGQVPGVDVNGTRIIIRGTSTINVNSDPLFLVDGNVVNSLDNISPQMVKSISVLKGPEASIYGSRGANGVILVTLIGSDRH